MRSESVAAGDSTDPKPEQTLMGMFTAPASSSIFPVARTVGRGHRGQPRRGGKKCGSRVPSVCALIERTDTNTRIISQSPLRTSSGDSDDERPGKDGSNVSGPISVLIAEDSLLVRDSVSRALSTDPDVTVVGVAEDYDSTVELIEKHQPSMLFTDVRMPPTSTDEGIRLARWMRTAHPDTGVIVLSQYADPSYAAGLLDGGTAARGYLLKERISHFDQLSEAVHQVAAGGTVLDPLVVEALLAQPRSAATLSRLTPREREVLAELATGLSNRTVAQRLVLSQRAVEKHINSIFAKLGLTVDDSVDRRVKAVLMFLQDVSA
jgi:DNA-binding NarL/FixJ family response regulator